MERRRIWKLFKHSDLEDMVALLGRELTSSNPRDVWTLYAEVKQELQEREELGIKDFEESI